MHIDLSKCSNLAVQALVTPVVGTIKTAPTVSVN